MKRRVVRRRKQPTTGPSQQQSTADRSVDITVPFRATLVRIVAAENMPLRESDPVIFVRRVSPEGSHVCAPSDGRLLSVIGQAAGSTLDAGSVVARLDPCSHEVRFDSLCALCGLDVTHRAGQDETVQIVHSKAGVHVTAEEAAKQHQRNTERLLSEKRLHLVLDLDLTLVHCTEDPRCEMFFLTSTRLNPTNVPDAQQAVDNLQPPQPGAPPQRLIRPEMSRGGDGGDDKEEKEAKGEEDAIADGVLEAWDEMYRFRVGQSNVYYLKLRPHTRQFLRECNRLFEMHIFTHGTRDYADMVARVLDPDGSLFRSRIVSRDDTKGGLSSVKELERIFPVDQSMVVVLDDKASVWSSDSQNVIQVHPYHFFRSMAEVNRVDFASLVSDAADVVDTNHHTGSNGADGATEGDVSAASATVSSSASPSASASVLVPQSEQADTATMDDDTVDGEAPRDRVTKVATTLSIPDAWADNELLHWLAVLSEVQQAFYSPQDTTNVARVRNVPLIMATQRFRVLEGAEVDLSRLIDDSAADADRCQTAFTELVANYGGRAVYGGDVSWAEEAGETDMMGESSSNGRESSHAPTRYVVALARDAEVDELQESGKAVVVNGRWLVQLLHRWMLPDAAEERFSHVHPAPQSDAGKAKLHAHQTRLREMVARFAYAYVSGFPQSHCTAAVFPLVTTRSVDAELAAEQEHEFEWAVEEAAVGDDPHGTAAMVGGQSTTFDELVASEHAMQGGSDSDEDDGDGDGFMGGDYGGGGMRDDDDIDDIDDNDDNDDNRDDEFRRLGGDGSSVRARLDALRSGHDSASNVEAPDSAPVAALAGAKRSHQSVHDSDDSGSDDDSDSGDDGGVGRGDGEPARKQRRVRELEEELLRGL